MCQHIKYHFSPCGCYARDGELKECICKRILKKCSTIKVKVEWLDEQCDKDDCPRRASREGDASQDNTGKQRQLSKTWGDDTEEALNSIGD